MIRIDAQPETPSFQAKVRKPGQRWLFQNLYPTMALNLPAPKGTRFPPFWRRCMPAFHQAYGGICAYSGTYIELSQGAASVDHFAAKSRAAGPTYEWDNYRLACLSMNAKKNEFSDVLDPFQLPTQEPVFLLVLTTGEAYVNPVLAAPLATRALATRERLKLDDSLQREFRSRLFAEYVSGQRPESLMRQYHPFVWSEIVRQRR